MKKIVVIDDDVVVTSLLSTMLKKAGYDVFTASNGEVGLEEVKRQMPDLVITDFEMPVMTGFELLQVLKKEIPGMPVVMLTCHSDVPLTIKSIQSGAYDYIEKPIQPQKLLEVIRNGIQVSTRQEQIEKKVPIPARKIIQQNILVGITPEIRQMVKQVGRISMNRMHVMLQGEVGTGKGQVAQLIHYSGITREHPFVTVDCEMLHPDTIVSELLGKVYESESGARKPKKGKLLQAEEGTVVLRSIERLPKSFQRHLVRIVEKREVVLSGSSEHFPMGARIITTSLYTPEDMLKKELVIPELLYHLNVFHLHLPPLRHRIDDISILAEFFIEKHSRIMSKKISGMESGTIDILRSYEWPGNLREFENAIAQAITLSRGDLIEKEHIQEYLQGFYVPADDTPKRVSLEEIEKRHIVSVLREVNWVKSEASKILQITRPTLNAKIEKYKLKP